MPSTIHSIKPETLYMRQWLIDNPQYKEYTVNHHKNKYQFYKNIVFGILGNVCKHCGFDDPRALQIDHINGDGYKDRRNINKGKKLAGMVIHI